MREFLFFLVLINLAMSQKLLAEPLKIREVAKIPLDPTTDNSKSSLVFLNEKGYLATSSGISTFEPKTRKIELLLSLPYIERITAIENDLYVNRIQINSSSDYSILRSTDGRNFEPFRQHDLFSCFDSNGSPTCGYLSTSFIQKNNAHFFSNPGRGNLAVSSEEEETWRFLIGLPEESSCFTQKFFVFGQKVLIGGECPLDIAYLKLGVLDPTFTQWIPGGELRSVAPKGISNRNIQFITLDPRSNFLFAGVEGGLLRSIDNGESFPFVLKYSPKNKDSYLSKKSPYISQIAFPSISPSTIFVGGFDKMKLDAYLAVSEDHGRRWSEISHLIPRRLRAGHVHFLVEGPNKNIFLGVSTEKVKYPKLANQMTILELILPKEKRLL